MPQTRYWWKTVETNQTTIKSLPNRSSWRREVSSPLTLAGYRGLVLEIQFYILKENRRNQPKPERRRPLHTEGKTAETQVAATVFDKLIERRESCSRQPILQRSIKRPSETPYKACKMGGVLLHIQTNILNGKPTQSIMCWLNDNNKTSRRGTTRPPEVAKDLTIRRKTTWCGRRPLVGRINV